MYLFIFTPWGAPAPQTPRVGGLPLPKLRRGVGGRQPSKPGGVGGGSPPRSEKQHEIPAKCQRRELPNKPR